MNRTRQTAGFAVAITIATLLAACNATFNTSGTINASGTAPASPAEVSSCKQACDLEASDDCDDAAAHAACYTECEATTANGATAFQACVQEGTCNPACDGSLASSTRDAGTGVGDLDAGGTPQSAADASSPSGDTGATEDASGKDASSGADADAAPLSPEAQCSAACASMTTSECPDFDAGTCDEDCFQTGIPLTAMTAFATCVQQSGGLCSNSLSCWQTFQTQAAN